MQARTIGSIVALFVAALLLVAATWVTATRTVADTGPAGAALNNRAATGSDLRENFLAQLRCNGVQGTGGDTTLREYFLTRSDAESDGGTAP